MCVARFARTLLTLASLVQPFEVCVSPDVGFLSDLHSHLVTCEVIGLLAGRWHAPSRCLYIQAAVPCKATERGDGGMTDVEMDPVSQIEVTGVINKHNLEVVGWYHNHPAFQPDPSVTDIENQSNYQNLYGGFRMTPDVGNNKGVVPFVGLIVGTYDKNNSSPRSLMNWFHIKNSATSGASPMKLETTRRGYIRGVGEEAREELRKGEERREERRRKLKEMQVRRAELSETKRNETKLVAFLPLLLFNTRFAHAGQAEVQRVDEASRA